MRWINIIGDIMNIISNKKSKKRKNKIQLINATEIHSELTKNLNEKNKEISFTKRKGENQKERRSFCTREKIYLFL